MSEQQLLIPRAPEEMSHEERLIELYRGRPHETCPGCGAFAIAGSTCPQSIPCPTCYAPAGSWCRRPSGHNAPEIHKARYMKAETMDLEKGTSHD